MASLVWPPRKDDPRQPGCRPSRSTSYQLGLSEAGFPQVLGGGEFPTLEACKQGDLAVSSSITDAAAGQELQQVNSEPASGFPCSPAGPTWPRPTFSRLLWAVRERWAAPRRAVL